MLRQTVGGSKEGLLDSSLAYFIPRKAFEHPFLLLSSVHHL